MSDVTPPGDQQVKTWRWTLLIHEPDRPTTHGLPHADGYLTAPDQYTATRLALQRSARLIPARWQGHIQITPASPEAAAAWRRQHHQPAGAAGPDTAPTRRREQDRERPVPATTSPRPPSPPMPAGLLAQKGVQ